MQALRPRVPNQNPGGMADGSAESNQNRAARYEDEKRRIVESCFSKKEEDGVAAESYITHVRVTEDAAYPTSPSPPDSAAANKKSRIILVAVRKTGRVRVHKARENPTGTFSIGKTWPLEELSGIQSYTNLNPKNNQENMEKQWAGGIGFIVMLGKSYYWQAPTPKEKDFFIGSLVKIYRKYTGGKLPELIGFAPYEMELLGVHPTPNPQMQSPIPYASAPTPRLEHEPQGVPPAASPPKPHHVREPAEESEPIPSRLETRGTPPPPKPRGQNLPTPEVIPVPMQEPESPPRAPPSPPLHVEEPEQIEEATEERVVPPPPMAQPEEEHRPGLGPMIKKKSAKDIAGQFRKAAMAASAFQPRQGGAGARLKALQDKERASNEPDGITSVVPAPLLRGMSSDTLKSSASATPTTVSHQVTLPADEDPSRFQPEPKVVEEDTTPPQVQSSTSVAAVPPPGTAEVPTARSPSPEKARSSSPERKKRQRQEAEIIKCCAALDLDPETFQGRGLGDYLDVLSEFGWNASLPGGRGLEDIIVDINREIGRAQATGWLGHVEQQESKMQDLTRAFDKAIEECEELDGLLTLYSHELDTVFSDIAYIEAQSQGLQVQAANQKLLLNELDGLMGTLSLSPSDLRGMQYASLDTDDSIQSAENALSMLYKALLTIDSDIRSNKIRKTVNSSTDRGGPGDHANAQVGQMRAVQEGKHRYKEAAMWFVQGFNRHMGKVFENIDESTLYDSRRDLWRYNPLMLFVREVNSYEWQTLITSYEMSLKGTYQNQFREYAMSQRKLVRKIGSEGLEALFTTQEKEKSEETMASTAARKLTVKRNKTSKSGGPRNQLSDGIDGKSPDAHEVFGTVVKYQCTTISEEQNYFVSLFHVSSQNNEDFSEVIMSKRPHQRKVPNLGMSQPHDPDRDMAKIVQNVTEGIFSFWLSDLQNLLDWTLGMDALQGVGVLAALEQCLRQFEDTNQEYITRTVRTLHERLLGLFNKFVDEQIRAIEETKVKVKKRKGVISFMRTFPIFSSTIEQMVPSDMPSNDVLEIRFVVDGAYTKILKAMWESLNFIAKDDMATGGVAAAPSGGDPEDKEALNYHILLIENMNHYLEEVDTQRNIVLDDWADKARHDFLIHLAQYTDSVIRRPLGKWLDFLESTEAMMKSQEADGVVGKPSHSKSAAKKVLASHDSKEIRKGVETLKKRVEKHFGDIEDPTAASKALVLKVFEECNARYANVYDRMKSITEKMYEGLEIDWRKEEVAALFKR